MTDTIDSVSYPAPAAESSVIHAFLIAEVRDYTRFSQERGDEAATQLVERFAHLARQVVETRRGKVIELRGDEALCVFSSARHALRAAVALQARYIEETERDRSLPLRVGIGLDAGEAQPFEGGFRGRAINLAARLKDMARAGQVLATEGLIHVAGQVDGLAYIERGLVHPKGFALPVHIVQIVATGQQQPDNDHSDEPEFRTFLFADIRGYSAFVFQHSAAAAADLQTRYTQLVEERVRAHGGRVLEIAGDGAFVVFVTPRQAVQSAIDLQEEFVRIFVQERQLPVTLSIGVEAGEAIPMMGKYVGPPINLAGVICQRTEPGEVLLGETLSHLVRKMEGLVLVDRGAIDVPGYPEPVRLTRLMRDSRSVPDSSAP